MLFKNITELQKFMEANKGLTFEVIQASISRAEIKFIVPEIGQPLYDQIEAAYTANTLSDPQKKLLALLQEAVASLALFLYIPRGELSISNSGISRAETTTNKTGFKYQVQNLADSCLDAGLEALERVQSFLEANKDLFPLWRDGIERKAMNALLIRTGTEFGQLYSSLRYPLRTYRSITSAMKTVEDITLAPIIGITLQQLRTKQANNSATTEETAVLDLLKRSIAYYTIAQSLVEQQIQITDSGVTLANDAGDSQDKDGKRKAADSKKVDALVSQCAAVAKQYLEMAISSLDQYSSPTLFPDWYTAKETRKKTLENNSLHKLNECSGGMFAI